MREDNRDIILADTNPIIKKKRSTEMGSSEEIMYLFFNDEYLYARKYIIG